MLIIIDAVIGAANPLIYRSIIDTGIGKHKPGLIVVLALVVAALAIFDAVLSLWQRWVSARIGEGLIFDMRTRVFEHIQKMPIAFFTRTQTGALVSRLNNDVLGAQQAFTDTFSSVVSNVIGVTITLGAMFYLSWPITLVALLLLPVFLVPARFVGKRLASITRRVLHAQRPDDQHHDRALQRRRGPVGQAVRPSARRGRGLLGQGASPKNPQNAPDHDFDRTLSADGPGGAAAALPNEVMAPVRIDRTAGFREIGPYRLLHCSAKGDGRDLVRGAEGAGAPPVALKLIKTGWTRKTEMVRFESERQALALMDHPASPAYSTPVRLQRESRTS